MPEACWLGRRKGGYHLLKLRLLLACSKGYLLCYSERLQIVCHPVNSTHNVHDDFLTSFKLEAAGAMCGMGLSSCQDGQLECDVGWQPRGRADQTHMQYQRQPNNGLVAMPGASVSAGRRRAARRNNIMPASSQQPDHQPASSHHQTSQQRSQGTRSSAPARVSARNKARHAGGKRAADADASGSLSEGGSKRRQLQS